MLVNRMRYLDRAAAAERRKTGDSSLYACFLVGRIRGAILAVDSILRSLEHISAQPKSWCIIRTWPSCRTVRLCTFLAGIYAKQERSFSALGPEGFRLKTGNLDLKGLHRALAALCSRILKAGLTWALTSQRSSRCTKPQSSASSWWTWSARLVFAFCVARPHLPISSC